MFGFGLGEILLVALIALVLYGDKDLPKHLKTGLEWVRKFKALSFQAQRSLWNVQREITQNLLDDEPISLQVPANTEAVKVPTPEEIIAKEVTLQTEEISSITQTEEDKIPTT